MEPSAENEGMSPGRRPRSGAFEAEARDERPEIGVAGADLSDASLQKTVLRLDRPQAPADGRLGLDQLDLVTRPE